MWFEQSNTSHAFPAYVYQSDTYHNFACVSNEPTVHLYVGENNPFFCKEVVMTNQNPNHLASREATKNVI